MGTRWEERGDCVVGLGYVVRTWEERAGRTERGAMHPHIQSGNWECMRRAFPVPGLDIRKHRPAM